MRILITGGSGQLGNEWVRFLNKQSVEFIALSSDDLDITDHQDVRRVVGNLKPNRIINCAAYTKVDQAEDEKDKAFEINGKAVRNLAHLCAEQRIKLMHFSTDYVFPGSAEDMEQFPNGYSEDHPVQPINVYGESKLEGEDAIKASGCDFVILRVSWLCGQYGHNFVKTMLKLGEERDDLSVVNDQFGCPTFAENVVENSWQLLEHNRSGTYHLSSLGKITWYDFAKEIFEQTNASVSLKPVPSSAFPTKAKRPAFSLLNTQKITTINGVTLIDWKQGLTNLLAEL